jgi:hypothetical protein
VDICLTEGDLSNTDGIAFLDELGMRFSDDHTHAIVLSGHGTISVAVDAVRRPYVVNYIEKDPGMLDEELLKAEVARAWRLTQARRAGSLRARIRPTVMAYLKGFETRDLVAALLPRKASSTASLQERDRSLLAERKDLEILLSNLLREFLPLSPQLELSVESGEHGETPSAQIHCWSRRRGLAMVVVIGPREDSKGLQERLQLPQETTQEKLAEWATQHFSGVVIALPDVSLEQPSQSP